MIGTGTLESHLSNILCCFSVNLYGAKIWSNMDASVILNADEAEPGDIKKN